MSNYRKVNRFAPVDAAYLAGLVDGEGTVSLSRRHAADERQLVLSISSTERELLEYVCRVVGAGRITSKRTYNERHAPSFTFAISNRQALDVLQQIEPHMQGYKRRRAQLVLQGYLEVTPRNGRYTEAAKQQRALFIERFFAITARPT